VIISTCQFVCPQSPATSLKVDIENCEHKTSNAVQDQLYQIRYAHMKHNGIVGLLDQLLVAINDFHAHHIRNNVANGTQGKAERD